MLANVFLWRRRRDDVPSTPKTIAAILASFVIIGFCSCSCCGSVCCGKLLGATCPAFAVVGIDGGGAAGVDVGDDCPFLSVWLLISVTVDVIVGRGIVDKVVPVIWGMDEVFAEALIMLSKDARGICDEAAVESGPSVCTTLDDDTAVDAAVDATGVELVAADFCCFFSSFSFACSSSSESESLSDDSEPLDDGLLPGEFGLSAAADDVATPSRRTRLGKIVTGDGRRNW